ncbi:hypothetical protein Dimus_039462 [Dionaea muscipula]
MALLTLYCFMFNPTHFKLTLFLAKCAALILGSVGQQVYIIDFGLAKKYRDLQTHKHIPYRPWGFCSPTTMISLAWGFCNQDRKEGKEGKERMIQKSFLLRTYA